MLETLKLSKTLKSSRDDFNVLDNFNVSSIKTAITYLHEQFWTEYRKLCVALAGLSKSTDSPISNDIFCRKMEHYVMKFKELR